MLFKVPAQTGMPSNLITDKIDLFKMFTKLKNLFTGSNSVDLASLITRGALIIDVRTRNEYSNGHNRESVNIPLDSLEENVNKLDKGKPIITVCASGMRSAAARKILLRKGFTEVYNGGNWRAVERM